jgi:hypothetical protein
MNSNEEKLTTGDQHQHFILMQEVKRGCKSCPYEEEQFKNSR